MLGRKVGLVDGRPPVEQAMTRAQRGRQRIGQHVGQLRQRVMHEHALHLGRHGPGLLVDRDDAAGVQRVVV